ncbi:hypothetical protein [Mycobacteroides abscessus]|uniref:hypothetical protein n=1 Tax=Mycobacteroides abscessus TaxID=36809 RepID=UPI001055704A|nr:hypothetical protein [Mycobacteroides abscessus]
MTDHALALIITAIIVGPLALWATAGWARATIGGVRGHGQSRDLLAQQCALMEESNAQRQELLNMGFSELDLLERSRVIPDRRTGLPAVSYVVSSAEIEQAATHLLRRLADAYRQSVGLEPMSATQ